MKLRRNLNLFTISQEAVIVQYDDRRIHQPAAIHLCCYFLADFAFWTALPRYDGPLFLLMFSLSRTLSALAVVSFPLAKDTGLAHAFAAAADKRKLRIFLSLLAVLLAVGMCLRRPDGAAAVLSALWVFVYYNGMAKKQFGGLSGDLAGWFLQTAELRMLAEACAAQYLEPSVRRLLRS